MKTGENGISTAAIVGIVVTVVVITVGVAAAVILLNPGAGGVGNLPLYGGATKADNLMVIGASSNLVNEIVGKGNSAPSDVQAEVYTATGSVSEILGYYRTEMANEGWTKLYDQSSSSSYSGVGMTMDILYFEKGDRAATVCAVLYTYLDESYTYFGRMEGPKTTFDGWMSGAGYEWVEPTTTTPTTTTTGGGGTTSLSCKMDGTYGGSTYTMTLEMKNIGLDTIKIRVEGTMMGQEFIEIINGEQQKAWVYASGGWQDMSVNFSSLENGFSQLQTALSGWTGGEINTTDPTTGTPVRIYDIVLNPVLADSLFIGQGGETTTPTTTTSGGTTTTTTSGGIIAGATSLDYKVDITIEGSTTTMRMRFRNIGTPNMDIREDITMAESTMSYILSGSQQQGWISYGTEWMSFSDLGMNFSEQWSQYSGDLSTYTGYLSNWTSGEWSESFGGYLYRIYDIQVDPTLPDSVFQPS